MMDAWVPADPDETFSGFAPVALTVLGIAAATVEALMDLMVEVKLDPEALVTVVGFVPARGCRRV